VTPALQNLMLAARAVGIRSVPTTLHPSVMSRFYTMFGIPDDVGFHFLRAARIPAGQLWPERSETDCGDIVSQSLGRTGPLDLSRGAQLVDRRVARAGAEEPSAELESVHLPPRVRSVPRLGRRPRKSREGGMVGPC
jgi:hypothetical protein